MARTRRNQAMRNLRSAGCQTAKVTGNTADKTAAGLFRRATTDHSGMGWAMSNMPKGMGFFGALKYTLMQFLIAVVGAILTGILVFF